MVLVMLLRGCVALLLLVAVTVGLGADGRGRGLHRDLAETIEELGRRVASLQAHRDRDFSPPMDWATARGVYESNIRINTFGRPLVSAFRQVGVYDNNAFATAWVSACLLEAALYGQRAPTIGADQMTEALQLVNSYHNKNERPGKSAVNFWPQTFNESSGVWVSHPVNIFSIVHLLDDHGVPWDLLVSLCEKLGPSLKVACDVLQFFATAEESYLPAFQIPADADDSLVNIGLGSLLKDLRAQHPDWYRTWEAGNSTGAIFGLLKKYAYRPLSATSANIIDPRTYYFARGFIEKAQSERRDVALVTTWIQNFDEERVLSDKGISMPMHTNNVDTTVAANVVYGITAALVNHMFKPKTWFDQDIKMLYENTTSFIEWVIDSGTMTSRPDLALTYYPSRYNFYWFVARTRFLLASRAANGTLPDLPSLRFVYERLNKPLQTRVTTDILAEAKQEGDWVYFDDFLGGADQTWTGNPKNSGDDRLFTTSMAVNTLIATWTTQSNVTRQLVWAKETPGGVVSVVERAVSWLNEVILTNKYRPLNAFFSGSVKGLSTVPFFYPANLMEYINGTKVPLNDTDVHISQDLMVAMAGVVTEEDYDAMVRQTHFGRPTPTTFTGYNKGIFPFWSSKAYTYATALLAFSQFLNLAPL